VSDPTPKARVLIVDADPAKLNVLKAALVHAAYQVISATSASFALTTLERDRPDLIVSGNRTEDMDGVEFCSIIRSDPAIHDIPFLLLSGPKRPTPWAVAQAGVDMLLAGDFVVAAVLDRIAKLLRNVAIQKPEAGPPVSPPPRAATPRPEPARARCSSTAAASCTRSSTGARARPPSRPWSPPRSTIRKAASASSRRRSCPGAPPRAPFIRAWINCS